MRPIDADELLTAFPIDDEPMVTKSSVRMTIRHMPTVKDAVEVVRCKDCDSAECSGVMIYCLTHGCYMRDNDFCNYGEWKDGERHGTDIR